MSIWKKDEYDPDVQYPAYSEWGKDGANTPRMEPQIYHPSKFFQELGEVLKGKYVNDMDRLKALSLKLNSIDTTTDTTRGAKQLDLATLFSQSGVSELQPIISEFQGEWKQKNPKSGSINFHNSEHTHYLQDLVEIVERCSR